MIWQILGSLVLAVTAAAAIPAAARKTIAETNAKWLEAMQRQDAAAIAAIYGDDAVFVRAGGDVVRGRGALERFERERFAQTGRVLEGTILDDGLTRAGELIYEWCHVTMRVRRTLTDRWHGRLCEG
jgi:ketosteroid isomerase-like protein